MALTNQQFESIMREYELSQNRNRRLLEERENEIYRNIPEYEKLVASTGSLAKACAKKLLDGNEQALVVLRKQLAELSLEKKQLLKQHGYPEDYLEPIYDCPYCWDTGYTVDVVGDSHSADTGAAAFSTRPAANTATSNVSSTPDAADAVAANSLRRKCRCLRQKEISLLYEQSNIQKIIEKENFSTLSFEYYEGEDRKRFQEAVRISLDFVQNFEQDYHNLFFYGTVGTGKSFLSGCIARELLQTGHSVIYFSSSGLFDTLARYSFDAKLKETLYNFYKDLYNCDLVIIDDLGTEVTNSFVTSQLFACLNERSLRRKATIISTNLSLEELRDRYSDRVFSRITSNFTICKLSGPDIRIYKKRMRK